MITKSAVDSGHYFQLVTSPNIHAPARKRHKEIEVWWAVHCLKESQPLASWGMAEYEHSMLWERFPFG